MQQIPIQALPNQAFTIILDNSTWDFIIKATNDVMSVSLALNKEPILSNARAVAGSLIIPSRYQEQGAGNFFFTTQNYQLPDYTQFGVTQFLIYISATELAANRVKPSPYFTAEDFNPIADLPLRFAPQGY